MAAAQPLQDPGYMAGYPDYCKTTNLPAFMYVITGTKADQSGMGQLYLNSLYTVAPATTPAGTTRVNWIGAPISTVSAARYATGFTKNKSELLPLSNNVLIANPNLKQNPGY
jgi:hypothetical protein